MPLEVDMARVRPGSFGVCFGFPALFLAIPLLLAGQGCAVRKGPGGEKGWVTVKEEPFGRVKGKEVSLFTLRNARGMAVKITNYGGIVTSLAVPDRKGKTADVVLGYDSLEGYLKDSPYFGALVGRYANRIAGGRFELDGRVYELARNDGPNHLHGGIEGFDKKVWEAEPYDGPSEAGVVLRYLSKDGEEGYPGNLKVQVTYALNDQNELVIRYRAVTDKPTPVNLTHHGYFNLKGAGEGDVLGHQVVIDADRYTVVNDELIPTGELRPVKGTPMDFLSPHTIGERIDRVKGGYDHNFVLNPPRDRDHPGSAALVYEPASGRVMEVFTTEPGLQFYTGNFLDGSIRGKGGKVYGKHGGFCMEAQHFPDSPNHPEFPSVILRPGKVYEQLTIYRFSAR